MTDVTKFYIEQLSNQYKKMQLSKKELCEVLGISLTSLDTLINKNQLPIRHKRIGNSQKARYIFPLLEVANYLAFESAT